MPLIIEGGRVPSRWADRGISRPAVSVDSHPRPADCISLALINNMPDAALEDTELQFFELLDIASGDVPVLVKLYSLTGIPRTDRGRRHLDSFYFGLDDLWDSRIDGVIVTGTEPRQPDLREEPYWRVLAEVLDWAERSTASTVLSCLAAHAGVLHSDGIQRHPLSDKQFGVFESARICDHELTRHAARLMRFPHSRWNEVREDSLTSCGYIVLTKSVQAGVDLFVKQKKKSLFVHFQGHPEYGAQTLLKEYRRDIKRFLRRERETYPSMPHGYFGLAATQLLNGFRENAVSSRSEEIVEFFPEAAVVDGLQNTWLASATCVYRNWLQYVISRRADTYAFAPMTPLYSQQRKPSTAS
jgi:homoserine O-succinyltransferase/O-acetyltransferase